MNVTDRQIDLAQRLKEHGLPWTPTPGHYVLDQKGIIEVESPFRPGVYFILDLKHFLRRADTMDGIKDSMCWLPDWSQAREILSLMGVPADQVYARLTAEHTRFLIGHELELLYEMIDEALLKT